MIEEYEKLLDEGGRTTLSQEGYGTEFHVTEDTGNGALLVESIVEYSDRATVSEINMSEL